MVDLIISFKYQLDPKIRLGDIFYNIKLNNRHNYARILIFLFNLFIDRISSPTSRIMKVSIKLLHSNVEDLALKTK